MQLKAGRLYKCSHAAYSYNLNKRFGLEIHQKNHDSVNIFSINKLDEIYRYLSRPIPFCSYCNIRKKTFMNKWDYSSYDILEWL